MRCPCGLGASLDACCGPILDGTKAAATAEALMRSRFSAFARGDVAHLSRSWHPDTRPRTIHVDPSRTWTRLEVLATSGGALLDTEGTVEFQAHHLDPDGPGVVHEVSAFSRVDGAWVYVSAAR